ncbi:MAG: type IV secretory system conjugative DNA transfer family protein, partial [Candidatus Competibacteraceae bacterium]|nr:type IV secretory system conjugative DNA transfer family protein [Candidatus Competibacteraceae bacterium]
MALTIFLVNGIVPSALAASSIPNVEAIEDGVMGEAVNRLPGDAGELRLEDVKNGDWLPPDSEALNPLRAEALNESALTYGARAGLYARMREIHRMLDEEAQQALDQNFPFAPLMLAHNVMPPVIQSGRNTVRKHHDAQLQFADAVFTILAPAKLAVTPPNW